MIELLFIFSIILIISLYIGIYFLYKKLDPFYYLIDPKDTQYSVKCPYCGNGQKGDWSCGACQEEGELWRNKNKIIIFFLKLLAYLWFMITHFRLYNEQDDTNRLHRLVDEQERQRERW